MMLCSLYALNIIINLILVLMHNKSKTYGMLNYCLFLYVLCGNKKISDYMNYLINYNSPVFGELVEPGYALLVKSGRIFGLDYNEFRMFCNIIFLTIVFLIIYRNMINPHLFFLFYSLFLVFMDSIQIRFFWSSCLMLLAAYTYSNRRKRYVFKTGIFLTMSILIHSGMISFFFLFLFILISDNIHIIKKYNKFLCVIILVICFCLFCGIDFRDYSYWISQTRLRRYLYTRTGWGFIVPWTIQFIQFIKVRIIYNQRNKFGYNAQKKTELLYMGSLAAFFFLPLYLININFYRIERGILFLFLCIGFAVCQKEKVKNLNYIVFLTFLECIIWLLYEIVFDDMMANILFPLFWHIKS